MINDRNIKIHNRLRDMFAYHCQNDVEQLAMFDAYMKIHGCFLRSQVRHNEDLTKYKFGKIRYWPDTIDTTHFQIFGDTQPIFYNKCKKLLETEPKVDWYLIECPDCHNKRPILSTNIDKMIRDEVPQRPCRICARKGGFYEKQKIRKMKTSWRYAHLQQNS